MGITNFTGNNDDDDNTGGNGTGNGGTGNTNNGGGFGSGNTPPPGFPGPSMSSMTQSLNNITDMLINYNKRFKNAEPTLFRDEPISQLMSVLIGKLKPNALLVGSAGVGKTKLVEDVARRIAIKDPTLPVNLQDKTIYEMPISSLVSGASLVGELEKRVTELVDFASDPTNNAIIFIDEIHVLMSDRSSTYEKIAQILKPALARGDMKVIGATTLQESRSFDTDPAFARRFSRLIIDELNAEQTVTILKNARASFMSHYAHKIAVPNDVLSSITHIAGEYAKAGHHRPDNALTLMDRSMADALLGHQKNIRLAEDAGDTIMADTLQAMPMIGLSEKQVRNTAVRLMTGHAIKEKLDESRMAIELSRIKGQDSILTDLQDTLKRDTLGVFPRTTPITWMFAGASGVGKTEVAKIIAAELTEQAPIILNMTEYNSPAAINRIIGSPAGYVGSDSNAELPFDSLESNPYRVILLDEIEKADKSVQRLFLSAFDEGSIRTSQGKAIDFTKAIIIATTNAARELLTKNPTGFSTGPTKPSHKDLIDSLGQHFDAEFLGRFSQIISFNTLDQNVYAQIIAEGYVREYQRIAQEQPRLARWLPEELSEAQINTLTRDTFMAVQGARPAKRAVKKFIENTIIAAQQADAATKAAAEAARQQAVQPAREDEGETEVVSPQDITLDKDSDTVSFGASSLN